MAALTHSRIPLLLLHQSMQELGHGPLKALNENRDSSEEVRSECCIKVWAVFVETQAKARTVFAAHSTSRDENIRKYVMILKRAFGVLEKHVQTALAANRALVKTPLGSGVWALVCAVERYHEIYVNCPPEELTDRSILEILALEHKEDFVFGGVTYPTVLTAFKALLQPQTPITPMSLDEMRSDHEQHCKHEEILHRHREALEREDIMLKILTAKFAGRSSQICLIATCNAHLWLAMPEEFRHPMDPEDTSNRLGDLLMKVRAEYRWKPVT